MLLSTLILKKYYKEVDMKKIVLMLYACTTLSMLYSVSVVTKADMVIDYGDENFYFYLSNGTGQDVSFCRKNSNPLTYKSDVLLKITEKDLEVEDLGEKYTSMAWVETAGDHKIQIYQLHGDFYMKVEKQQEPLELTLKHLYEIHLDDKGAVKIVDIQS